MQIKVIFIRKVLHEGPKIGLFANYSYLFITDSGRYNFP